MIDQPDPTNPGTAVNAADAELQALREQAAKVEQYEAKIQAKEQLASDLGYDSVEAMEADSLEAIQYRDQKELEGNNTPSPKPITPAKPATPAAPPAPAGRSAADILAMETYLGNMTAGKVLLTPDLPI